MPNAEEFPWPGPIRRLFDKDGEWLPADGERPEGVYLTVGGAVDQIALSLRIFGPTLNPEEITRLLGCVPSQSHRAGDPVSKDGRGRRPAGAWILRSTLPGSASLDDHLRRVLEQLPAAPEVWARLHAAYTLDVFCGLFLNAWNRGTELSAQNSLALSERQLAVTFDIYSDLPERSGD